MSSLCGQKMFSCTSRLVLSRKSFMIARAFSTGMARFKSVAVVLSGNGVYDGSEVHEASAVLVHLSRAGADVSIYAPDIPQLHVIDHTKGEPVEETRNVLQESARIARGEISPLSDLEVSSHDAVVFPGGFGAAKNLSSFAVDGVAFNINADVEQTIRGFHSAQKPIGLCCIAPVLAAKLIPGCEVTVGQDKDDDGQWPYAGTAEAIQQMGATHINKNVDEVHVDQQNRIVTTPAFMCETHVHRVHDGIGRMIQALMNFTN